MLSLVTTAVNTAATHKVPDKALHAQRSVVISLPILFQRASCKGCCCPLRRARVAVPIAETVDEQVSRPLQQGKILQKAAHQAGPRIAVSLGGQSALKQLLALTASAPLKEGLDDLAAILLFDDQLSAW